MHTPVIWRRPDLLLPQPFDSIFFDVDGVLIQTTNSFRVANIATTEYIVRELNGLDWGRGEGKELITLNDIEFFKQAGGFNSDWDMCYLLVSLTTAKLREWRSSTLAERTTEEWATLARAASLQGHGGRKWVDEAFPASARPAYSQIIEVFNEFYWGTDELNKRLGHASRYLPYTEGFVQKEEMLYEPNFFACLKKAGVVNLGMITGRTGIEVDSAVERMEAYSGERWWDVIISADTHMKPDPQALWAAIDAVGTRGGLYIGDTADDFDLVCRYKAEQKDEKEKPAILAAMVVHASDEELYKQRGADILVRSVEDLLALWPV
jgi:phosphoglycolate phosphatase-like HAD superfamily hydrolase